MLHRETCVGRKPPGGRLFVWPTAVGFISKKQR